MRTYAVDDYDEIRRHLRASPVFLRRSRIVVPPHWILNAKINGGVLAGGCLRDLVCGRMPPKDVDVFVPGHKEADGEKEYADGFKVTNVVEGAVTYQYIKHRFSDIDEMLDHFDVGLCQIAYDADSKMFKCTAAFFEDFVNRTLTVLRNNGEQHEKHLASVRSRYPDYRVVVEEPGDLE